MGFDFGAGERRLADYTRRVTAIQEQAEETQARVRTLRYRTTSADQCIRLAVENPAAADEFRVFGYLDNVGEYSPDGLHPIGYPLLVLVPVLAVGGPPGGGAAGGDLDTGESSTIATVLAWVIESPSMGNRATAWLRSRNSSDRPVLLSALLVLAEDGRVPVRVLDRMVTHLADVRIDQVEEDFRIDLTAALRRSRG
jgi:hypothetical protein